MKNLLELACFLWKETDQKKEQNLKGEGKPSHTKKLSGGLGVHSLQIIFGVPLDI